MSGLMYALKQEIYKRCNAIRPVFRAGDTIRVSVPMISKGKEIQKTFEGFCVKKSQSGFSVRKNSGDDAVEINYSYLTPSKVEVIACGKVRRGRLYYMRDLRGKKARIKRDFRRERKILNANN